MEELSSQFLLLAGVEALDPVKDLLKEQQLPMEEELLPRLKGLPQILNGRLFHMVEEKDFEMMRDAST